MRRLIGAVMLSLGLVPAAALAGERVVAWSTYLRSGPGETFAAIAEVEHDRRVQLLGCGGAWCRVVDGDVAGYVDRDALALPPPPPPVARRADCVTVGQADNRGPIPTRFCAGGAR